MPIANVALSNTFNELRTTTNDVITQVNELYALTGVTPGTYGSSSLVPIITVTNQGRVTSIVNTAIAGVTNFNYFSANSNFLINTSDGGAYATGIGQDLGTEASVSFQNLTVTGNVTFTGNTTTISANNLVVEDNIIQIGKDNITDVIDLGFLGHYNNGANVHTGLFRDATDGIWKFFQNYPIEPGANTNIDTSNASFQYANVIAHHITSNGIFYGNGSGLTTLNASNVSSGTLANARTTASSSNGASTIIARDASGGFSTNTITANSIDVTDIVVTTLSGFNSPSTSNSTSTIVARDASGNFTANTITVTDLNSTSDITLKENVVDIENALDIITKLSGIRFTWQGTDDVSYGLSAQQVEQILPEIVKTREDGKKGINYLNIIALLIESIKSLNKEIQNLKSYK